MVIHIICYCRPLKEYYESLKPLFVLDPLLVPNFLYCCSINDIQVLSSVVPPCYTIAWMAYKMNANRYAYMIDLNNVSFYLSDYFSVFITMNM